MKIEALPDEFLDELMGVGERTPSVPHPHKEDLTWCEFCKGYYIEEFHVERWVGEQIDSPAA